MGEKTGTGLYWGRVGIACRTFAVALSRLHEVAELIARKDNSFNLVQGTSLEGCKRRSRGKREVVSGLETRPAGCGVKESREKRRAKANERWKGLQRSESGGYRGLFRGLPWDFAEIRVIFLRRYWRGIVKPDYEQRPCF